MCNIYYICNYCTFEYDNEKRQYPLSGTTKINSILDSLRLISKKIDIVSISMVHGDKAAGSHYDKIKENVYLKLFKSYGRKNFFIKLFDRIQLFICFIIYLFYHIKKEDIVIVYHSLAYTRVINILKKVIGFKLILEVEEIYSDVLGKDKYREVELKQIKLADAYMFPSYELATICNHSHKPYVVIHGTYDVQDRIVTHNSVDGEYINIVYAGTLDFRKGCIQTIKAGLYLSDRYRISILGTDRPKDFGFLTELINKVNNNGGAQVKLYNKMIGTEYNSFLQSCDIGMCTQDPCADFTMTSFPSKILSYLSNGLRVVTVDIPSVKNSDVADLLYFYKEQTPRAIAECIKNINFDEQYDSKYRLMELKKNFLVDINKLLKEIKG